MNETRAELVKERLQLQQEMREHFAKEGFDYPTYLNPPPGSWLERYNERIKAIDAVLSPELECWKG